MTQVKLFYKRPDGVTPGGVPITEGSVAYWLVRAQNTTGGLLTKVADQVPIGSTVNLDPETYFFQLIDVSDGRGGVLSGEDAVTCRIVPASGGPFEIDDLAEANPSSLNTAEVNELKAYIDLKTAGIVGGAPVGTGPGGAFYSIDVKDTTATGRAVMKAAGANLAAEQLAARTAIGAGTSNLVIGSGAGQAADGAALAALATSKADAAAVTTLAGTVAGHTSQIATITGDIDTIEATLAAGSPLPSNVVTAVTFSNTVAHTAAVTFNPGSIAQAAIAGLIQAITDLKAQTAQRIIWNGTGYPAEVAGYASYHYSGPASQPPSSFGRTLRPGDIVDSWAG